MTTENARLDLLLSEMQTVYSATPPGELILEPLYFTLEPPSNLLATVLEALVVTGALVIGQAPDASGSHYRAYGRGETAISDAVALVIEQYEVMPEDGYIPDLQYSDVPWQSIPQKLRHILQQVNAISPQHRTDENGRHFEAIIRGNSARTLTFGVLAMSATFSPLSYSAFAIFAALGSRERGDRRHGPVPGQRPTRTGCAV